MQKPVLIKLLSFLLSVLACLIAVGVIMTKKDWLGKTDVLAFLFWTVPLAAGLAAGGGTIVNLFRKASFVPKLFFLVVIAWLLSYGWTLCVAKLLGSWINSFSLPVLYLWIGGSALQLFFLAWRFPKPDKDPELAQVILGLLLLPLMLIFTLFAVYFISYASSAFTKPDAETFLIPENYKGKVLVVFNQPDGEAPEHENGRRLYKIPESGVLFTQLKSGQAVLDKEYYYISADGHRKRLPVRNTRDFSEEPAGEKNLVESGPDSIAVFNAGTIGAMSGNGGKDNITFSEFSVGTSREVKTFKRANFQYVDSLRQLEKNHR